MLDCEKAKAASAKILSESSISVDRSPDLVAAASTDLSEAQAKRFTSTVTVKE